jgi:hypothetical protein
VAERALVGEVVGAWAEAWAAVEVATEACEAEWQDEDLRRPRRLIDGRNFVSRLLHRSAHSRTASTRAERCRETVLEPLGDGL